MKLLAVTLASLSLLSRYTVNANEPSTAADLTIVRSGSQPSSKGSDDYFTGTVRVDPLFPANEPSRVSGGLVTFEPGARSAWHTHPARPER